MTRRNDTKSEDVKAAAEATIKIIQKRFGEGAVMYGSGYKVDTESIPTGSLGLDIAIGIGGFPVGRIGEIYGPEGSGKTTICLSLVAQAQRMGKLCAFVDMEHALDPSWARKLGVDVDQLAISQPDTGEQALEIAQEFIQSGAFSIVIVDSVAALVPRAEIEGEMGDSHMGLQARLMSQALRKLTGLIQSQGVILLFTNQLRDKIGITYGSPETTPGGKALKFYASVRLDIRRKNPPIKENGEVVGHNHMIKVKKNKVAAPFKEAMIEIRGDVGLSIISEIVSQSEKLNIIQKGGAWYKYMRGDEEVFKVHGTAKVKEYLNAHSEIAFELHNMILEHHGMPTLDAMPDYSNPSDKNNDDDDNNVDSEAPGINID